MDNLSIAEVLERAGVCAFDLDECTVTLAFDSEEQVRAVLAALPSRSRVRVISDCAREGK